MMSMPSFGEFGASPFDDLVKRFLGGDAFDATAARPALQRVNLSRMLSRDAEELIQRAVQLAAEGGSADLDTEHLLRAATQQPASRQMLQRLGAGPDHLADQIHSADSDGQHPGEQAPPLTPAAKRALLEAQQEAQHAGASYVGPERIVLGLAASPDTPAGQALHQLVAGEADALTSADRRAQATSTTPTLDQCGRDPTAAEAVDSLADRGYQPQFGARPLRRTVQRLLDDELSEQLLAGAVTAGETVDVTVADGNLVIAVAGKATS